MYVSVCMHACMYVCIMYVCVYVCMYVYMYVYLCMCLFSYFIFILSSRLQINIHNFCYFHCGIRLEPAGVNLLNVK